MYPIHLRITRVLMSGMAVHIWFSQIKDLRSLVRVLVRCTIFNFDFFQEVINLLFKLSYINII